MHRLGYFCGILHKFPRYYFISYCFLSSRRYVNLFPLFRLSSHTELISLVKHRTNTTNTNPREIPIQTAEKTFFSQSENSSPYLMKLNSSAILEIWVCPVVLHHPANSTIEIHTIFQMPNTISINFKYRTRSFPFTKRSRCTRPAHQIEIVRSSSHTPFPSC